MAIAAQRNIGIKRYAEWIRRIMAIKKYNKEDKYIQRYHYFVSFAFGCTKYDNRDMALIKEYIRKIESWKGR